MGVGSGLYMYDVVVKRSRSLSHLLMSSRSFNFNDFGTNRKLIYNFLLVNKTNLPHILHHF